jgi:hypothetical protein
MNETGDKLNAAYRALPLEEPRAAIDAAILAASRRALEKPSASRHWAAPVSIAAVLVLAFGVTLRMQQEKPGVESPDVYSSPPAGAAVAPPAVEPEPMKQEAAPAQPLRDARPQPEKKKVIVPAAKPDVTPPPQAKLQAAPAQPQAFEEGARQRRDEGRLENEQKDLLQKEAHANVREAPASAPKPAAPPPSVTTSSVAAAAPPVDAAAPASRAAPAGEMRLKREAFAADAGRRSTSRRRELRAIAKLRVEGRREEADKARGFPPSATAFPTPCGSA